MSTGLAKDIHGAAQAPASGAQRISAKRRATHVAKIILDHIAVYLGPGAAQSAMTTSCRAIGREPESVELQDVPQLFVALSPTLATLLGGSSCRILLRRIEHELLSR